MRVLLAILILAACLAGPTQAESWTNALARMPLGTNVTRLTGTNCVRLMLDGFQPAADVKALIFMPGATDELYFFNRVEATLTNPQPSLLDAVVALTNQTPLRATFRSPFLLLYSDEDVLDLDVRIQHPPTVERLRQIGPMPHWNFDDRDWDFLLKSLRRPVKVTLLPRSHSADSWHFYRHSFASWNLSAWEALQACALAGKTRITIHRGKAEFQPDPRFGVLPKLDHFPR